MADKKSVQIMVAQPTDKQLYSQWERQTSNKNSSKGRKQISFSARTESATLTASTGQTRADRQQTGSVTKLPAHSRQTTSKEEKEERIRLLELKTASTRKAIANHREREKELIKENLMMKQSIQATERPDHEAVKKLMRRYEKFRGGISFLNENFTTTLQKEESGLRALERRLEVELGSIQQQVDGLDERLQRQQNQVYILNNYKDKEYPVKAIRIGELMTELDEVELENDDEFFDLERVIDNELDKLNNAGWSQVVSYNNNRYSTISLLLTQLCSGVYPVHIHPQESKYYINY